MKRLILSLLCCYYLTSTARAQTESEVLKRSISYTKPVPSFALRAVPTEGRSLYWGKFIARPTIQPAETPIGVHLFALYTPELEVEHRGAICHFALDIFSLQPKPQLLNRIFLVYKYAWPPTTFGMFFTWVDPKKQSIPLIVLRSFSKGIYGPLGIEHVVAFPRGWRNRASISNLNFGTWRASDTGGQINRFTLGHEDHLEIQAFLSPTTSELTPEQVQRNYTFTLRWTWNRYPGFTPVAEDQKVIERYFDPYQ